jgi:asparagine synthase (glutamine-hydrolysing)
MSRIAGIISNETNQDLTDMLSCQLPLDLANNWGSHIFSKADTCIGFIGSNNYSATRIGNLALVIDGTIYNLNEFGEGTDAEVFVKLYKKHGFSDALTKINGDFAIALIDFDKDELWLARDRVGVKPLYYTSKNDLFAFASRCKALLLLDKVSKQINVQYTALIAAGHYRYFDNQPNKSPYEEISQLPAASWLRLKNGEIYTGVYWQLEELSEWEESEEILAEHYRALLLDATAIRLDRSTNPGFTLSGGMDSSSIIGSAVKITGKKQQAFSSTYDDKTFDESDDIATILDLAVSKWHQVKVSETNIFGIIEKMIEVNDEPVATATWLSHFKVCEKAGEFGITDLFGGLGGDELNAGEYEHFFPFFADLRIAGQKQRLENEVSKWAQYHSHPLYPKNSSIMEETVERICDLNQHGKIRPDRQRLDRYHGLLNPDFFDLNAFEPIMDHPFRSYLKNRCYQDIFRETSPCCLRAQDRQGMAFGIQHVMPFFDYRIIEFMFRVPAEYKYSNGVTKNLLRKATVDIIPESTRKRIKKTGWNAPAHLWFSEKGTEPVLDVIKSKKFREHGIYNIDAVEKLILEHSEIVSKGMTLENHMMIIWQLLNLEFWLKN